MDDKKSSFLNRHGGKILGAGALGAGLKSYASGQPASIQKAQSTTMPTQEPKVEPKVEPQNFDPFTDKIPEPPISKLDDNLINSLGLGESISFKQRVLTENFLKDIDRNVLRPKQYKQYKEALQTHNSAVNQYTNEYQNQLETYNKYKNSPNAPEMLKQMRATKEQLDYHSGMLDHLKTNKLQALKYTPQEMDVKNAKASGLKIGSLAGGALGLGAGLATHMIGGEEAPISESRELQKGVLRDVSNGLQSAALMGGLTAAGAIAGHAMEDNVQDAVSDGFEKLSDIALKDIENKVANGQALTPDEQNIYDSKHGKVLDQLSLVAANKIGAESSGSNLAKHSTLAGAGLGALMAARLNQAANKKQ